MDPRQSATQPTTEAATEPSGAPLGPRLDDQLCFALYAATHAITRRYRPLLAEIGLTYPQYLVMLSLWQDGPAPVGRIAERLELDSHAVTPLVERLEVAGLVRRDRGTDRRRVVVSATGLGRDLRAAAEAVQARVACETGLDPDDLADLRERLRALAGRLSSTDTPSQPAGGTPPREGRPT